ncbi:Bor family protein [Testudinibacter sp. P27/CKL/0425]
MKKIITVISLSLLLSACSQQAFVINNQAISPAVLNKSQSFYVYGVNQTQTISAAEVCGSADKVAKVESQLTFKNWLLGTLTLGIYAPREARVYCNS